MSPEMFDRRLSVSLCLSVCFHLSLYFGFAIGDGWGHANLSYPMFVTLAGGEAVSDVQPQHFQSGVSAGGDKDHLNATPNFAEMFKDRGGARIAATEEQLDAAPQPIFAPVLEPEYGFADDVDGIIKLSLLVNSEGNVVFDLVVHNDFDAQTTSYLLQQFRSLRFTPPTANGKPVYAWLSYAVTIQRKDF